MDGGTDLRGTVIVFFGHDLSRESCSAYRKLRASAGPGVTLRWLLDMGANTSIPSEFRDEILTYNSAQFADWGFPVMGATMLPGHCHFPLLRLYEKHPEIERLWLVEYDVRFTGKWRLLFDHFATDDADLITCHIKTQDQEPRWHWWPTLSSPVDAPPVEIPRVRAFLVVARYSAAALRKLAELHRAGWRGHQEVIIPSLLLHSGMKVRDINDASPAHGARRFYISVSGQNGALEEFGTMRYRPARTHAGFLSNTLYHPVKPPAMIRARSMFATIMRKLAVARRLFAGR